MPFSGAILIEIVQNQLYGLPLENAGLEQNKIQFGVVLYGYFMNLCSFLNVLSATHFLSKITQCANNNPRNSKFLFYFFADEESGDGQSNLDYSCTLTPLFSIELLSNQSYILQLNFSPPRKNISSIDEIFSTMSSKPALIQEISLTVIVEDDNFHAALFYLKCLCVPFVLGKNSNSFLKKEPKF